MGYQHYKETELRNLEKLYFQLRFEFKQVTANNDKEMLKIQELSKFNDERANKLREYLLDQQNLAEKQFAQIRKPKKPMKRVTNQNILVLKANDSKMENPVSDQLETSDKKDHHTKRKGTDK